MSEKNVTIYGYGVVFNREIPSRMQFSSDTDLKELLERFERRMISQRRPQERKQYEDVINFLNMAEEKGGELKRVISSMKPEITVSFGSKEVVNLFIEAGQIEPERIIEIVTLPMPNLMYVQHESFQEALAKFESLCAISRDYDNKLKFKKACVLLEYFKERGASFEWSAMKDGQLFVAASFKSIEDIDIFEKTVEGVVASTSVKKA